MNAMYTGLNPNVILGAKAQQCAAWTAELNAMQGAYFQYQAQVNQLAAQHAQAAAAMNSIRQQLARGGCATPPGIPIGPPTHGYGDDASGAGLVLLGLGALGLALL